MPEKTMGFYYLGLVILIALSAFFSAAETAFISANKIRVRLLAEEEKLTKAIILNRLLSRPNRLLATVLVGNNIANIAASALATAAAVQLFPDFGVTIATAVVTTLVLIFGEITPKSFATQKAEKLALQFARPIELLSFLLYPLVKILTGATNFFIKLLGGKPSSQGPFVTEEEIRALVIAGEKQGLIEAEEKEMIDSIFEFDDTIVREVMIPRIDVAGVPAEMDINHFVDWTIKLGHSRIPVYEGSLDNIVGIVYVKDLLPFWGKNNNFPVQQIMRPAYFTPESKKINDLLQEFQQLKIHMAVVLDEYGGTAGIVTFEDLLEEIVGDIQDEYDQEEEKIQPIDDRTIIADARTNLDEINERLNLELPEEEFDTIGGFFYSLVGRVPKEGETVEFEDCVLTVCKVNGRRIKSIQIKRE